MTLNNDFGARRTDEETVVTPVHETATPAEEPRAAHREAGIPEQDLRQGVVAREKAEFGGMKFGTAFFGWLSATGLAVILGSVAAAIASAAGVDAGDLSANVDTVGLTGAIVLLVILFIAYFAGGYVAGRMARFSGAKQGVAVWLWGLAIGIIAGVVAAVAGSQYNILANVNAFPRVPIGEANMTVVGIVTALIVIAASLVGAVLGGLAGMRFHRRVDRIGLS